MEGRVDASLTEMTKKKKLGEELHEYESQNQTEIDPSQHGVLLCTKMLEWK